MDWSQLISNTRLGQKPHQPKRDDRSEFKRDYDRLIFSAPFRRLQNKTQVFPLPGSVFVHNRLTHSLEVASVGMSLGNDVSKMLVTKHPNLQNSLIEDIGTIVASACLAHDMGNPPFGHSGERAIQTFFSEGKGQSIQHLLSPKQWKDLIRFEGNANAFRLLTHRFQGRRAGGFALTYTTLASIVKYPYTSDYTQGKKGKFGFFHTETEQYQTIAKTLGIKQVTTGDESLCYVRHPLVYLVEAADDICYEIMDLEDAFKLHILSYNDVLYLLLNFFEHEQQSKILNRLAEEEVTDLNEKVAYLRACVIGLLEKECVEVFMQHEEEILEGTFKGSLIRHISEIPKHAYEECVKQSASRIYKSKPVLDVELSGYKIMTTLLEAFVEAAINPDRYYSEQLMHRMSEQYDIHNSSLDTRVQAVIDYISGMTDVYALDIYQKIQGMSLPIV